MIILMLIILGLCLGSFVNALVWRVHKQANADKKNKKQIKTGEYSILKGRSMCPHCHHELAARDLIPVFSWLLLRGRCRYCHKPISWQYPLVEALTALFFVISYLYWPVQQGAILLQGGTLQEWVNFGFWKVFLTGFMALAVYDIRWFLLPDRIVLPLIAVAFIQVLLNASLFGGGWNVVIDAFWGVLFVAGTFLLLYIVSKGKWIGDGDITLGVILGMLVGGPLNGLLLIFVASVLGSVVSLPLLFKNKQNIKTHVPFGPFLMAATFIVVLFGHKITDWYLFGITS